MTYHRVWWFGKGAPGLEAAFFLFVLGIAAITLFTSGRCRNASGGGDKFERADSRSVPLSYAIRLHRAGTQGPGILLFAMVIIWVGTRRLISWAIHWEIQAGAAFESQETWEGRLRVLWGPDRGSRICAIPDVPLGHLLGMAAVGNVAGKRGICWIGL